MKFFQFLSRIVSMMFTAIFTFSMILLFSGIYPYVVLSGSMEPTIKTGSIILVQTRIGELESGDIITYQLGNENITHRIVSHTGRNYITKGDANEQKDFLPVKRRQIKGKVVCSIPSLGYVVLFIRTLKGICLLLLIFLISFLLRHFIKKSILKSRKENTGNSEEKYENKK